MVKTIAKIGNPQGLILETALLELAGLKVGDWVTVTIAKDGTITLTPVRRRIAAAHAARIAKSLVRRNRALFKRLA